MSADHWTNNKVVNMGRVFGGDEGSVSQRSLLLVVLVSTVLVKGSPLISVVNVEPEQYAPDTQIQDQELLLLTNVTSVEIHCEASYPIFWEYSGYTSPMQLQVRAVRKSGPKLGDPTFTAQLAIYRVSSSLTGTYYCRSVLNPEKFDKVHVFAQEKGYRGQDPILLKYGQVIDVQLEKQQTVVKIPCATWDPKTSMSLFRKSEDTGKYEILQPNNAYTYDPKSGFDLNLTQLDRSWGHYFCSPELNRTYDRVYVNLHRKPDNKFTPETKTIEIVEGDDLHIRCESQEEVTFYVNGVEKDDSRITIKKEHVSEGDYPFVATLIYRHLVPADASEIQCIRNPSGNVQVIKNWSYRVVGQHDVKRRGMTKYHSKRLNNDWFACWSRTSVAPDVSFVQCTNSMECGIKGHCLQNANKCDTAETLICSGGCTRTTIENRTGILQCKGDGVFQQIRQFIGVNGAYWYNSIAEATKDEKLSIGGNHIFKVGMIGEFTCKGSSFIYAGGFRFGIRSQNHVLRILEPGSHEVVRFEESFLPTGHIIAKAVLHMNSTKWTQINCFAPFWNSTDWDSRTHAVYLRT